MYLFLIWYHNNIVVQVHSGSLEEIRETIEKWPWPYNVDDCVYHLYVTIPLSDGENA